MSEQGITEVFGPSGDLRYQVVTKIKDRYVMLGWYTTHARALKALKQAQNP